MTIYYERQKLSKLLVNKTETSEKIRDRINVEKKLSKICTAIGN